MRLKRFGPVEHRDADTQLEAGGDDSAADTAGTAKQGDARPGLGTEPPSIACGGNRFVHDGQKCVARHARVNRGKTRAGTGRW
jgi:hypothetical protein